MGITLEFLKNIILILTWLIIMSDEYFREQRREREKENEAAKAKVNAAREAFEATLKTSLSEKIKASSSYVKKNGIFILSLI